MRKANPEPRGGTEPKKPRLTASDSDALGRETEKPETESSMPSDGFHRLPEDEMKENASDAVGMELLCNIENVQGRPKVETNRSCLPGHARPQTTESREPRCGKQKEIGASSSSSRRNELEDKEFKRLEEVMLNSACSSESHEAGNRPSLAAAAEIIVGKMDEASRNPKKQKLDEPSTSSFHCDGFEEIDCKKLLPPEVLKVSESLFRLYEPDPPQAANIDIVFFHGLQLEATLDAHLSTWKSGDDLEVVWPQCWLHNEVHQARVTSVSYDWCIERSTAGGKIHINVMLDTLLGEIMQACNALPVILVGHGVGGMIMKQLCSKASRRRRNPAVKAHTLSFLDRIRGMFFYDTPHREVGILDMEEDLKTNNQPLLRVLDELNRVSPRLHEEFCLLWRKKNYHWIIHGVGVWMDGPKCAPFSKGIPEASSHFCDIYMTLAADHFSICRPTDREDQKYTLLIELIRVVQRQIEVEGGEHLTLEVPELLLGVEPLLNELVERLLQDHTFLGLSGMVGSGKTTMAKLVYNKMVADFEYTCFVEEVREMNGRRGLMTDEIWKSMRRHGDLVKASSSGRYGWSCVMEKKLLLVFDGIVATEDLELLEEVVHSNASKRSRFIVTSRSADLLRRLYDIYICHIPLLTHGNAVKLFLTHAVPSRPKPLKLDEKVVEDIVTACGGLPLTLEVLGRHLREIEPGGWKDVSRALRDCCSSQWPFIKEVWYHLRSSIEGLGEKEKDMFLDVATFFGDHDSPFTARNVLTAWSSFIKAPYMRVQILQDRSLLYYDSHVRSSRFHVHEHLRILGTIIARDSGRICKGRLNEFSEADSDRNDVGSFIEEAELTKVVAYRLKITLEHARRYSGGDPCRDCMMQKIFKQLRSIRYLELHLQLSESCKRCITNGEVTLPSTLVMLALVGCTKNLNLSQEHPRQLVVLKLLNKNLKDPELEGTTTRSEEALDVESLVIDRESLSMPLGHLSHLRILDVEGCAHLNWLSEAISRLGKLEELSIKECIEVNTLPDSFEHLSNLVRLDIEQCVHLECLPKSFGKLTKLQEVSIKFCYGMQTLQESFASELALKRLDLEGCTGLSKLPESLGSMKTLEELCLKRCSGLIELPKSIGQLSALKTLKVDDCINLDDLPDSLGDMMSLEELSLKRCKCLRTLPESLGSLSSLERLDGEDCINLYSLPDSLGEMMNLVEVNLKGCRSLRTLSESLGSISSLKRLDVADCAKLVSLPNSLGEMMNLVEVKLKGCRSLRTLPESLGSLSSLKTLDVEGCGSLVGLPNSLGEMINLVKLNLKRCFMLKTLPESLGSLSSLKRLDVEGCDRLVSLPNSLGEMINLVELNLEGCRSLRTLPESLGRLSSLKRLDVEGCGRLVSLPNSSTKMINLVELNLRGCRNFRTLPESLGSLSSLKRLDVEGCSWLVSLPNSLGELINLVELNLERCRSLRTLPESLGRLSSLKRLDVQDCGSLVSLPYSLGEMMSLEELNLKRCFELRTLPESFGSLSSLKRLDVEGCGRLVSLPNSMGDMMSLEEVNLKRCFMLRTLPESLGSLSSLKRLDVEGCYSLVSLPNSLGEMKNLVVLNFRKEFEKKPESLLSLSSVEKLDV